MGRQTFYTYGADGQLTGITDPQVGLIQWQHNAHGQLTERTDCSSKTERYHYDADGWLSTLIDALEYNAAGQVSVCQYQDIRYDYDAWQAQWCAEYPVAVG